MNAQPEAAEGAVDWAALSSEDKRQLVKFYADDDLSAGAIAKIIGVTRNAIIGVVHRSKGKVKLAGGLSHPPSSRPRRPKKPRPPRRRIVLPPPVDVSPVLNKETIWQPLPGSQPAGLLQRTGCAFPVQVDGRTLFCNCAVKPGTGAYCEPHAKAMRRPKK